MTSNGMYATDTLRSVVSTRTRPHPPGRLSASLTFAWRSVLKVKHVPEQVLDVLAIPIIFTLMFTYLFGGAMAGSTGDYLRYLLPGTLVMTVLLLTMYTGVGLNTDVASGAFDRFRSLPIWRPSVVIGALIGDVARYLIASGLVLGLGFAMGYRADGGVTGVLAALGMILLFAFGISWIWTAVGLVVRSPSAVMNLGVSVLFPLTMASNVFVEPDTTPSWLQAIISVNPVSHLVTAVRGVLAGSDNTGDIGWVVVATLATVAVFAPLTMRTYVRRG